MQDPTFYISMAGAAVLAVGIVAGTTLRGWTGWLDFKRAELQRISDRSEDIMPPSTATRIEVADLKERIRKLEAIAAGVDL